MRTVEAASGVVIDDAGRLLLIVRTQEPEAGKWTVPGGCVEPGESYEDAAVREVLEETGVHVVVTGELWTVTQPAGVDAVYEIHDFLAVPVGGELCAGDDAGAVRWFTGDELERADLSHELLGLLREAGLYSPASRTLRRGYAE